MKRMVYIIIAATALLILGSVTVGCSINPSKQTQSDIVGVSLSQSHMNYTYCYSFFLRKEDGKVLFDADVRFEDSAEIILESCEVEAKYYNQLINFVNNNEVRNYVNSYKKKPSLFQVMDETTNTTTLYFADGTDKSADSGTYENELCEFFTDLAINYRSKAVQAITE
ncbi:MAG: hypothetical protein IJ346_08060 [Clostridia bacterium]|nr:hypothetical protein [Clostridia bacterium]